MSSLRIIVAIGAFCFVYFTEGIYLRGGLSSVFFIIGY